LPIAEIEPGLDVFAAICQEMPTPRGYIDNLLMTGVGDVAARRNEAVPQSRGAAQGAGVVDHYSRTNIWDLILHCPSDWRSHILTVLPDIGVVTPSFTKEAVKWDVT